MQLNLARQVFWQSFTIRLLDQRLNRSRPRYGLNRFFLMQCVEFLLQLLNLKSLPPRRRGATFSDDCPNCDRFNLAMRASSSAIFRPCAWTVPNS